ncbi:MAG: pyridoxal phosphate-dependent aminotransferase [Spirochaetaceae bacterium]|jgi:alanine-synthesizing transaminase|nr:pyridoxal phosphate-dependent aminotransferase [Spirochaetaceae bacterium]
MNRIIEKSTKLNNVCYDIRGPVLKEAKRLEEEGYSVIKLNIGNPALFGFNVPDVIAHDIIVNLKNAQGYGDSQGLFAARKAIVLDLHARGIMDVDIDDVYLGNGVSELIMIAMQGLLNSGDEVLIPMPDYPLWTAAVTLSGGRAVHYRCDEESLWNPDLADIQSKLSDRTKAMVIINPNNPTGAVYSRETLEGIARIAAENDLIVYSDEIYDRIIYDGAEHIPMALVNHDTLTVTFNGLSKAYRAAGFRSGWMTLSGNKKGAAGYLEGLNMLSNMRLCANMPAQFGIQTALGGYQSITDYLLPGGRLKEQRDTAISLVNQIPGLSVVAPRGALYCFPRIDAKRFAILDDELFMMDLLREKHLLLVHGTGFNWDRPDHFRIVFLPDKETLTEALRRLGDFLATYRQGAA